MKLFYALTFDEASRSRLYALARTLLPLSRQARVTPMKNIHLTLLFLGEVEAADMGQLTGELGALPPLPTTYRCNTLGSFGSIIWASIEPDEPLRACNAALVNRLKEEFPYIDRRPLVPHITLMRKADKLAFPSFRPIELTAESIALLHSCQERGSVTYTPMASRPLAGNPASP